MTAEKIYIVDSRADNVFVNQAVEAALTDYIGKGCVALMLWANPDTVVIGRNQDAYAECRVDLLESNGGTLARRLSGGGAVFHNIGDLNFTFVADEELFSKDDDFDVVTAALAKFGITAERTGRNDLTVAGAKFSGNAYRYAGGKKLHHGTLIIRSSPEEVAKYLTPPSDKFAGKSVKSVQSAVVALSSLNPEITRESLTAALKESFVEKYAQADVIFLPPTALGADAGDKGAEGGGVELRDLRLARLWVVCHVVSLLGRNVTTMLRRGLPHVNRPLVELASTCGNACVGYERRIFSMARPRASSSTSLSR